MTTAIWVSAQTLADNLKVDVKTVYNAFNGKLFPSSAVRQGRRGREYHLPRCKKAYEERIRGAGRRKAQPASHVDGAPQLPAPEGPLESIDQAMARKLRAEADLAEIKRDQQAGRLLDVDDSVAAQREICAIYRAKCEAMPLALLDRITSICGVTDNDIRFQVRVALEEYVEDMWKDIADHFKEEQLNV